MRRTTTERSWKKTIGLVGLTLAAMGSTGCGRMGGGLSIQGPGINVQVGPLGYGSSMPSYGGQAMPNARYMDPRYAYAGQVGPNGQYMDPNQMAAMQQQQGYYPNGQYLDPNQLAAQQQAAYYGQNPAAYQQNPYAYQQTPYAYQAAAPATTQAAPTTQAASAIPGSGLVASPFAPGTTQPLAGPVQASFG